MPSIICQHKEKKALDLGATLRIALAVQLKYTLLTQVEFSS